MKDPIEPTTSPSLLFALRQEGNEVAWDAFFSSYEPLIRSWYRRQWPRPGDQEEFIQDVKVKLFLKLRDFDHDPSRRFRGWLSVVVRNIAADYWRDRLRQPGNYGGGDTATHETLQQIPDGSDADAEATLQRIEDHLERERRFQEACDRVRRRVSERRWQAFWLMSMEGRRGKDVAEELGMTVGAVHVARHYVVKLLREAAVPVVQSR